MHVIPPLKELDRPVVKNISPDRARHAGCYYHDTELFTQHLYDHLEPAMRSGHAGMIVALPETIAAVKAYANGMGTSFDSATAEGRFLFADAQLWLKRFMVDGMPQQHRFNAVVGGQLLVLAHQGQRLHLYAEMGIVLHRQGLPAAALQLEDLWNVLGKKREFDLMCGYPMDIFESLEDSVDMEPFRKAHDYERRC